MPPHLHPRSRLTTSLFGTTLLVSFLVVGLPHLLPCPAPRTQYADSELPSSPGRRRRRRRRPITAADAGADATVVGASFDGHVDEGDGPVESEGEGLARKAHQCPVPRPGGRIGEVLGFKRGEGDAAPSRTKRGGGEDR